MKLALIGSVTDVINLLGWIIGDGNFTTPWMVEKSFLVIHIDEFDFSKGSDTEYLDLGLGRYRIPVCKIDEIPEEFECFYVATDWFGSKGIDERKLLREMMEEKGLKLAAPFIHPSAIVSLAMTDLGQGCIIGPFSVVAPGCTIGKNAIIGSHESVYGGMDVPDDWYT